MTQLDQNPFRIYHPRNISEFKVGDLIMRVKPVTFSSGTLFTRDDSSYMKIPYVYKRINNQQGIIVEVKHLGVDFVIPALPSDKEEIPLWHEGWDYVNPEDEPKKEKSPIKRESSIKKTNLTAFLRNH